MSEEPACPQRWIAALDLPAPLIVPSFSSRGFKAIVELLDEVRPDLDRLALVSAFDLGMKNLDTPPWELADIGLLDSGGYEMQEDPAYQSRWTRARYRALLRELAPAAPAIVVSYDTFGPLAEQVQAAREDAAAAPDAILDLLIKPPASNALKIDLDEVCHQAALLAEVSIIGVTEDELGDTVQERCAALARLRAALDAEGCRGSLHVFGCLRPQAVLAYTLAGADIFDGLGWLRADLRRADLERPDRSFGRGPATTLAERRDNLELMRRLEREIRQVWSGGDRAAWAALFPGAEAAVAAAETAGARLPWQGRTP